MESYYFLFGLALVFTIFASIQDIRKREVSNWLNFSLIAFAFLYRMIYSIVKVDISFLIYGIAGFVIFFILANAFYYGKVFAGGDAKLLMGYGLIMPFNNYYDLLFVSVGFIILLFIFGAIYSILYSSFLAYKNRIKFYKEFKRIFIEKRWIVITSTILFFLILIQMVIVDYKEMFLIYGLILILFMPLLYVYLLSIEKSCMITLVNPYDLTEGDWIEKDIKVNGKVIKKTVHGLDIQDILLLRRFNKKIFVKQGVPFVPAFLFAFIAMVFFYLSLKLDFQSLFFYLF